MDQAKTREHWKMAQSENLVALLDDTIVERRFCTIILYVLKSR